MISADDRVVVTMPNLVHAGFKFDHVINMRSIFNGPVHSAANATLRKIALGISAGQLFKNVQHPILIELAIGKVNFRIGAKLELSALLCYLCVNTCGNQAPQMILLLLRVENMNSLVARFHPVLDERKQDAIFLLVIVEKGADMTRMTELRASKGNRCRRAFHSLSSIEVCI